MDEDMNQSDRSLVQKKALMPHTAKLRRIVKINYTKQGKCTSVMSDRAVAHGKNLGDNRILYNEQ